MIDIRFQCCCETCPHIAVTWETANIYGANVTVIGCEHACVCADYNTVEEEMPPPGCNRARIPRC